MNDSASSITAFIPVAAAYIVATTPLFAVWEVAQLPLYTIWSEQGSASALVAAMHCTLGDMALAAVSFGVAATSTLIWPALRAPWIFAAATVGIGIAATIVLELVSTLWLGRWAYMPSMPQIAGVGLSPVLQWLVVPGLGLAAHWHMVKLVLPRTRERGNQ